MEASQTGPASEGQEGAVGGEAAAGADAAAEAAAQQREAEARKAAEEAAAERDRAAAEESDDDDDDDNDGDERGKVPDPSHAPVAEEAQEAIIGDPGLRGEQQPLQNEGTPGNVNTPNRTSAPPPEAQSGVPLAEDRAAGVEPGE